MLSGEEWLSPQPAGTSPGFALKKPKEILVEGVVIFVEASISFEFINEILFSLSALDKAFPNYRNSTFRRRLWDKRINLSETD